jgi:putative transcriptional regulator
MPLGDPDKRAIRERLGLARPVFAKRFGLAVTAVRNWEQGLHRPDPAARVLLMVIARRPETVAQVVTEAKAT